MKIKEIPFLIYYSIKSLLYDLFELIDSLKKPKTWSYILYAIFFISVYYENYKLMKIALPLILILYIIRQDKEPEYKQILKKKAFENNDVRMIEYYYCRYKRDCYYSGKKPEPLEEYKEKEFKKLTQKNDTESDK